MEEFERLAFVHLKDKEQLCQQLYVHFKPAYYRLRYGLPQMNPMTGTGCRRYIPNCII
ncbi:PRD domain-containing protein [Peribacillus frigoritolerans]|nr:PRD domain-containing protein [Peribacillus frigoritolerans]